MTSTGHSVLWHTPSSSLKGKESFPTAEFCDSVGTGFVWRIRLTRKGQGRGRPGSAGWAGPGRRALPALSAGGRALRCVSLGTALRVLAVRWPAPLSKSSLCGVHAQGRPCRTLVVITWHPRKMGCSTPRGQKRCVVGHRFLAFFFFPTADLRVQGRKCLQIKNAKDFFNNCVCNGFYTKSFLDTSIKTNSWDHGSEVPTTHHATLWSRDSSAQRASLSPGPGLSRRGGRCLGNTLRREVGGGGGLCSELTLPTPCVGLDHVK